MLTLRARIAYHLTVLLVAAAYPFWRLSMAIGLTDPPEHVERDANGDPVLVREPILGLGDTLDECLNACMVAFIVGCQEAGEPEREIRRAVKRVWGSE